MGAVQSLFTKDHVDNYQGVLVPLSSAKRHPTVEAEYARRRSAEGRNSDGTPGTPVQEKKVEGKGSDTEDGVMRTTSANYSPYTIEGLRAEIMEDADSGSGGDTAYDRKFYTSGPCVWWLTVV